METTRGLFATVEAAPGREEEVEKLLVGAESIVEQEPKTAAWFALRFGRGDYGIFDAFPDDAGRDAHRNGGVAAALKEHADLFDGDPVFEEVDVLADKRTGAKVSKGLMLRLPIKDGNTDDAAGFLRDGEAVVNDEPATSDWFALKFENGEYGVFDVFPDSKGRRAHLVGKIPQQLALHGLPWLKGLPHMSFADVMAQRVDVT
jgi:hypothetical protein